MIAIGGLGCISKKQPLSCVTGVQIEQTQHELANFRQIVPACNLAVSGTCYVISNFPTLKTTIVTIILLEHRFVGTCVLYDVGAHNMRIVILHHLNFAFDVPIQPSTKVDREWLTEKEDSMCLQYKHEKLATFLVKTPARNTKGLSKNAGKH